ncbi:polymorphic toxin-type HINT domain-containing protein [Fastidiosibacter lacustris]|uniref:polymorphic toxin-type HINT domain-containing protein n=1 Tax=Fastidiosibacter lacustris TaxID=2056695 RepID=UPI000E34B21A|nr:polymorphic toxin-type HINT domain-containing protein [Fastidiosibacter lacustris]
MKIILFTLTFLSISYGRNLPLPSYDFEPITPKTWQKVELKYSDIINGKEYPAEIKMLRPIDWLRANSLDKIESDVNLSIPEFGVENVQVTVTAIQFIKLDISGIDWSIDRKRPVISLFKRYAEDVRIYTFKDDLGNIEQINATPNHPFYIKNKGAFVEIDKVLASDELLSQTGKQVKLVCPVGQNSSCGKPYNKSSEPIIVYNLEVYREHIYFVGDLDVLVHNKRDLVHESRFINKRAYEDQKSIGKISYTTEKGSKYSYHKNKFKREMSKYIVIENGYTGKIISSNKAIISSFDYDAMNYFLDVVEKANSINMGDSASEAYISAESYFNRFLYHGNGVYDRIYSFMNKDYYIRHDSLMSTKGFNVIDYIGDKTPPATHVGHRIC